MTHTYFGGTIGERIHDLLVEKKMTQATLAEKIGVSAATMTRYVSGTSQIPHTVLQKLSKALGVSVDFLLCNTNVPYRTNFDIDELGLTAEAAAKLYTGEADPQVVSKLIVNQHFPRLAEELKSFVAGTNSAAIASYNQVMKITGRMLQQQGKIMPHDKTNARNALRDVQAHMIPPEVPDMTMIRTAFELVLGDLKKEADVCVQNTTKVTGSILDDMIRRLDKRRDKPDLRQLTVNDITDAIMEQISGADIPDEEREKIRENLVGIFQSVSRTSVTKSRGKK